MKQYLLKITLIWIMSIMVSASYANDSQVNKAAFINYYESGEYFNEIEHIASEIKEYLTTRIVPNEKLAVIFDIDETSLTNYDLLKEADFPQERENLIKLFNEKAKAVTAKAITPTLDLYHFCVDNNIAVFFITGRPDYPEYIDITQKHLKQAGYSKWNGIFFHPKDKGKFNKSDQHLEVINQGYKIALNIGDQERDLIGDYAEKHVKLPNPFYRLN